jgi:hypothetical protein
LNATALSESREPSFTAERNHVSNFTLGVNFARGWYSYQDDHSFQLVVHGINTNYSLIG